MNNLMIKRHIFKNNRFRLKWLFLIGLILVLQILISCLKKDIEIDTSLNEKIKLEKVSKSSYNIFSSRPVYFLLLGSDSRTENFKGLSDSIMLVKVDPKQNKISLVSFPRDSRVKIPGVGRQKINAALVYGGPELSIKTVEELSGLKIDYYLMSTFAGFKRIIEEIGGVKIVLDKPLYDRWSGADFEAGQVVMNGEMALAFCRARHIDQGDFTRAAHQQDFVEAVYQQEKNDKSLSAIAEKVKIIDDQLEANLKPVEIFKLGWLIISLDKVEFEKVVLPGTISNIGGGSYVILDKEKTKEIFTNLGQGLPLEGGE